MSGSVSHEIDFIEVEQHYMWAFECKTSAHSKANPCQEFKAAYPDCPIEQVTPSRMQVFKAES